MNRSWSGETPTRANVYEDNDNLWRTRCKNVDVNQPKKTLHSRWANWCSRRIIFKWKFQMLTKTRTVMIDKKKENLFSNFLHWMSSSLTKNAKCENVYIRRANTKSVWNWKLRKTGWQTATKTGDYRGERNKTARIRHRRLAGTLMTES